MEQHRANPACNACHGVMDPLGFALENFDTIGHVSRRGPLHAYEDRHQRQAGGRHSGERPGRSAELRCWPIPSSSCRPLTEKLTIYALGRSIESYDMPSIRTIVRDSKATNYRFSSIVMGIVNAPAFRSSIVEDARRAGPLDPPRVDDVEAGFLDPPVEQAK
jgi:hypothetical protein